MYLTRAINLYGILFLLLVGTTASLAQSDSLIRVPSPYKSEYNPWFKFDQFKRGFQGDSVTMILDDLEKISRSEWSRLDSLNFAQASLHSGNLDLSAYYFSHLHVKFNTERKYWWDLMMLHILNKDYEAAIEEIHKCSPGILEYSKIYFLDKILLAYRAEAEDSKWHKTHSVTQWKPDSSLMRIDRRSKTYQERIINPLENLNFVLKQLIHFIHDSDPVIARTCFEMGRILEEHVSLTQAYIAYNLGRNYNKWDKEILNHVKQVKAKLSKKRYKIPIFRRYFPRTENWRFDYEVLKQKIIIERSDTLPKITPTLLLKQEKRELPFDPQWIIIGGLFLLFILVRFLLKTEKK